VLAPQASPDGLAIIDPAVNFGQFQIQWGVRGVDGYHVRLFVSEDSVLDSRQDVQVFGLNCGGAFGLFSGCDGGNSASDCRFDGNNRISCGTVTSSNPGASLTQLLTALPQRVYLILETCDALFAQCPAMAVQVEFR